MENNVGNSFLMQGAREERGERRERGERVEREERGEGRGEREERRASGDIVLSKAGQSCRRRTDGEEGGISLPRTGRGIWITREWERESEERKARGIVAAFPRHAIRYVSCHAAGCKCCHRCCYNISYCCC